MVYEEVLNGAFVSRSDLTVENIMVMAHALQSYQLHKCRHGEARRINDPPGMLDTLSQNKRSLGIHSHQWPHRIIYKACATDEVLVMIHVTIVFFAFKLGLKGVYRWHKSVDYILEKRNGPVQGELCTTKILDCKLNFGLKWAFTWRLG